MMTVNRALNNATTTLIARELHAYRLCINSWYHVRVNPSGGKEVSFPLLKDIITRITIGRKINT
jgi:hypothetical protein